MWWVDGFLIIPFELSHGREWEQQQKRKEEKAKAKRQND